MLFFALAALALVFAGWRIWRRLRYFLHMAQLEGYRPSRLGRWYRQHLSLLARPSHGVGLALLLLSIPLGSIFSWSNAVLLALILWPFVFISSRKYRSDQQKKPLAYTNRLKRLMGVSASLALLLLVACSMWGVATGAPSGFLLFLTGLLATDFLAPQLVLLGTVLVQPVERYFQEGFKRQARRHIASRPDLTIIGVTGSFGKTSTKFVVAEILRQKYNVLATPGSYNTPMGLCLVINERLRPEHQMLILEMGMRYRGDIRELCEIAQPDAAIVTSVGPAHLETMGTIENIAREKSDIIRHARSGAPVFLNMDDPLVAQMAEIAGGRVWRVSANGHREADIVASDIAYGPEGTSFTVRDDTGSSASFTTKLLGSHNVLNILLGVAVGREMGLRLRQIAHAVKRVDPVKHRLQLRQKGGVTIIDDAFNSNPVGARNAVEILGQFNSGRRVIVTPGMVEMGERQDKENRALGELIAEHADLALLVGRNQTEPIREGLRAGGFPDEQVKVFDTLFDAQDFLKGFLRDGDVVLYENDLPDQYEA